MPCRTAFSSSGCWLLRRATALHSREFFSLAVITLALAMAVGASLLGVSLALGAFLTGIVMGESDVAHRILGDAIPLRDAFSGICFVSIGMLLDPAFLLHSWAPVLLAVAMIILVKGTVTSIFARWLGCSPRLAVLIGAGLAQSAEFSFLLARIGLEEGALTAPVFNLLLTATIVSILLAPATNTLAPDLLRRVQSRRPAAVEEAAAVGPPAIEHHAIVCGYGRVGSIVCALLERHGKPYVVIEEDFRLVDSLRARGVTTVFGDAALPDVLEHAHIRTAQLLILCFPERMAVRRVDEAVIGEMELALELGRRALKRFDVAPDDVERSLALTRRTLE